MAADPQVAGVRGRPNAPSDEGAQYPAYVEFTVRMNVESEWEFETLRKNLGDVARRMSTIQLHGDEAAVQVLYRKRPGVRPVESDPQDPPPFTFEQPKEHGA